MKFLGRISFLLVVLALLAAPALAQTGTPPQQPPVSFVCSADLQPICDYAAYLVNTFGWWLAVPIGLLFLATVYLLRGLLNWVEKLGEKLPAWLSNKLRPKDPTQRYLLALLKDFRDPKYQPFTGDDVRRPRLEDVYLALDLRAEADRTEAEGREGKGEIMGRVFDAGRDRAQLPAVLKTAKKHLALVGGAGSGKSTFVQWAGLVAAKDFRRDSLDDDDQRDLVYALNRSQLPLRAFNWLRRLGFTRPLFPVFVPLGEFDRYCLNPFDYNETHKKLDGTLPPTADSVLKFVCWRANRQHLGLAPEFLQKRLREGALLLLDGVDEVVFERRQRVRDAVQAVLKESYFSSRNRVLLTSRPPGYDRSHWSDDFLKCEVQPMTAEQRDQLIRSWFRAIYTSAATAREKSQTLVNSLNASDERVQAMATTPLLTTIFAKLQHNAFRIPDQRALLYKDAVDLILDETYRKTDSSQALEPTRAGDRAQRLTWLSRIAFELHQTGVGEAGLIVGDLLPKVGQPAEHPALREFMHTMAQNACLLEETQPNYYGFRSHRTFEEFLAGRYLMTEFAPNDLRKLMGFVRDVAASPNRDQWEEPLRLAVGYQAIEYEAPVRQFLTALSTLGESDYDESVRDWVRALTALALYDLPEARQNAFSDLKPTVNEAALKALTQGNSTLNDSLIAQTSLILARTGETRVAPILEAKLTANPPVIARASQRRAIGLALATLGDLRLATPAPSWCMIPAGRARLGTSAEDEQQLKKFEIEPYSDEKPAHTVTLSEYWLGKYPVTNAEFARFLVGAKGYEQEKYWGQDGWRWRQGQYDADLSVYKEDIRKQIEDWLKGRPVEKRHQPFFWDDPQWNAANLPVVGVTWFEAEAYCKWLTEQLQLQDQLPAGWRVRLPTEAEWEKAARRAKEEDGRLKEDALWPWGNDWDSGRCNNEESQLNATTPVGMYPHGATAEGVEDLIGNVWEWCWDGWDAKAYQDRDGKADPFTRHNSSRVLRGGAFNANRRYCRAALRNGYIPDFFLQLSGFRVCASPILHAEL